MLYSYTSIMTTSEEHRQDQFTSRIVLHDIIKAVSCSRQVSRSEYHEKLDHWLQLQLKTAWFHQPFQTCTREILVNETQPKVIDQRDKLNVQRTVQAKRVWDIMFSIQWQQVQIPRTRSNKASWWSLSLCTSWKVVLKRLAMKGNTTWEVSLRNQCCPTGHIYVSSNSTIWARLSAAFFLINMPHLRAALSLSQPTTALPDERVRSSSKLKLGNGFGM